MFTIIAKVTHDCNLQCKYCYVSDDAETGRMDIQTLKNFIYKIPQLNTEGQTNIIWHGGEPLLMGIDFYKTAINLQREISNHKFNNSIQSNGTLLNDELVDFFEKNNFRVGLSIDGDKTSHDNNRPYKNGKSSFEDTLFWIKELKSKKIGGSAICILNKNTAPHILEIYNYAKENGINFKFNPQLPAGRALTSVGLGLTPEELGETYIKLFDLWFHDNSDFVPSIDPLEGIVANIGFNKNTHQLLPNIPYGCTFKNNCAFSFLAIVPNGNVYPCGRFIGNSDFLYGNINEQEFIDIINNPFRSQFIDRHKGLAECDNCEYQKVCNSGCPDHSYLFYGNIKHKDPYCITYKMLFKHIEASLVDELKYFQNE